MIYEPGTATSWANKLPTSERGVSLAQRRLFLSLAILAVFVSIWTAYSVISAAPAAIHNDLAEAYVWGREFQFGYSKHPPFWASVVGLWFEVFPRADWAFALLATLNAGLGLYGSVDAHRGFCRCRQEISGDGPAAPHAFLYLPRAQI